MIAKQKNSKRGFYMVEKIEKNVLTAWERVEIARNPKRKTA